MSHLLDLYVDGYIDACEHSPDARCLLNSQAYRDGYEAGIIDSDNLDIDYTLPPELAVKILR